MGVGTRRSTILVDVAEVMARRAAAKVGFFLKTPGALAARRPAPGGGKRLQSVVRRRPANGTRIGC